MKRLLAVGWLILLLILAVHLLWRLQTGLNLSTDILALLPREPETPLMERVNQEVSDHFSRRMILLLGASDPATVRHAAQELSSTLNRSGLVSIGDNGDAAERLKRLGALYFPYRRGLLSDEDRTALLAGKGQDIATAALSQIYGFASLADVGKFVEDAFGNALETELGVVGICEAV